MGNLRSMEQEHYWHPQMQWYGPSGIGACLSLEEFEDFHQRPWLQGFGDRGIFARGGGRRIPSHAEGNYLGAGAWDTAFSHHYGNYLNIPPSGKLMTIRNFDWWRREGEYLVQNWVPIDMINLILQSGVDLFDRLLQQVELRKQGKKWFDPVY
jgi:hypothetical protein